MEEILYRGGRDTERLYFSDAEFILANGKKVIVKKSDFPGVHMLDVDTRHRARYGLLTPFCRPDAVLLDFPCGSGYGAELLAPYSIRYEGKEYDDITLEYAKKLYGNKQCTFSKGDLTQPDLKENLYDVIGCIEGLEHIDSEFQKPLLASFYRALKMGGTAVISSPVNPTGVSGPSAHNKDHKWELTKKDFLELLVAVFGKENVEYLTLSARLSTGVDSSIVFGVCHKN